MVFVVVVISTVIHYASSISTAVANYAAHLVTQRLYRVPRTAPPRGMPIPDGRATGERETGRERARITGNAATRKLLRRREEAMAGRAAKRPETRGPLRSSRRGTGVHGGARGERRHTRPSYFNILSALRGITHTTAERPIFEAKEGRAAREYPIPSCNRCSIRGRSEPGRAERMRGSGRSVISS